jgi:uroporphyrinogen-III synthase
MAASDALALDGVRIAVTRALDAGTALNDRLRAVGATVVHCPATRIERLGDHQLREALQRLRPDDWLVCTSVNGVRAVVEAGLVPPPGIQVAAVGPATAAALRAAGITVSLVPAQHDADGLVAAMTASRSLVGVQVCFPAAEGARPTLVDGLEQAGAVVTRIVCYASRPDPDGLSRLNAAAHAQALDLVVLAAPSAVEGAASILVGAAIPAAVIGPVTAAAARAAGVVVRAESPDASIDALVQAILAAHRVQSLRRDAAPLTPA